jgi:hypothetical protein
MDGARALFRKNNTGLDGNIKTAEVGRFMMAAGLNPSPGEVLNAHRVLDPRDEGVVVFSDLENWLSEQCLIQKRAHFNRLLIKAKVGKAKKPSYDVPGQAHTYGAPVQRDSVSGKQLIFSWNVASPSKSTEAYVDRVKMNRAAVKKGCVTAKDFVQHSQTDRIYTYAKQPAKAPPPIDVTQAFGQKPPNQRRHDQPSMADLIKAKFNEAMFDEEVEYPKVTSKESATSSRHNEGVFKNAPFNTNPEKTTKKPSNQLKHTKASRLAAEKTRQQMEPVEKKVFTLKQFRNVGPRVNTRRITGSSVVENVGY